MSIVARMFAQYQESEITRLQTALHDISVHIGGSPGLPETVVEAAESTRERLCRFLGYSGIPRDADGHPVAYAVVGR